jgi:hypothetical protein
MIIAKRLPFSAETVSKTTRADFPARTYKRIVVLLNDASEADQMISTVLDLNRTPGTTVTLICHSQPGAQNQIDQKCRQLQQQRVKANGYLVNYALNQLPDWLLRSEQADAIIMAQEPVGWLGRLLGMDAAHVLETRTQADVITVG